MWKNFCRLVGIVLAFLPLLFVISVFLPDEELTPEVRALLEVSVPLEGNAFAALLGFDVAATDQDLDFVEEGKTRLAQIRRLSYQEADVMMGDLSKHALKFSGEMLNSSGVIIACGNEMGSRECVESALANARPLREFAEKNQVLLQRYQTLRQMPIYRSECYISAIYLGLLNSSRLLGALAALDIAEGQVERGLVAFAEDFAFYRRVLTSSNLCLLDSLVTVAMMRAQLKYLSGLIDRGDYFSGEYAAKAREILTPVFDPARTFAAAMQGEAGAVRWILDSFPAEIKMDEAEGWKDWFDWIRLKCCYRKQMTLNLSVSFFAQMAKNALALPPERVRAEYRNVTAFSRTEEPFRFFFWKNSFGEMLANMPKPSYFEYLLRYYDNAAYLNYVRAQLEYRLAQKGKENPEKLLQSLGSETFDPYTGQPFAWDKETGKLRFNPAYQPEKNFKDVEVTLR